jgi:ABC-2 type transport system ATP-binding protein
LACPARLPARARYTAWRRARRSVWAWSPPSCRPGVCRRTSRWLRRLSTPPGGWTIVFAAHYLEEADAYADRVVLISKGRIVADGTAAEVKRLASGRTIRATLPGADEAALRAMPGVDGVEVRGDTVLIHSGDTDTDAVARRLLNQTAARDLEITSRGLEEAFIALTGDGATRPSAGSQAAT